MICEKNKKITQKIFVNSKKDSIFAPDYKRVLSSAGSEHLPYKQRVTGSNPVGPTLLFRKKFYFRVLSSAGSEHLPYKQRVTGSNPVGPTEKSCIRCMAFFI